ncbi:MAG: TetR family transcriptional regulator [Acidimicrobiia bacterium]|nr:TetR family transcriptional regulator [Acidimicrobiia bacterium]
MAEALEGLRSSAAVLVARTRARVQEAVFALLQDEGLDAVTHLRVAQASGVGRATLYRHWPTRESLILDTFAGAKGPHEPQPTGDLRADLLAYLAMLQDGLCQERFGSVVTSLVGRADWDPVAAKLLGRMCEKGTRHLAELLEAGRDRGSLRPDLDVDEAVARIVGPVVFSRLVVRREIDRAWVVRLVDDVLRQFAPS